MPRQIIKTPYQIASAAALLATCCVWQNASAAEEDSVANSVAFNRYALISSPTEKPRQAEYYNRSIGLYFGASDAYKPTAQDRAEYDTYAGIAKQYGSLGYNLGVKAYNQNLYTQERNLNEFFVGGNYKLLHLGYATSDLGEYTQISLNHEIDSTTLEFHMGNTKPERGDSYYDWRINAIKKYKSLKLNASLVNREVATEYNNEGPEFNLGVSRTLSLF